MCASLYTALSAREALMKSPSDGELLAGIGRSGDGVLVLCESGGHVLASP